MANKTDLSVVVGGLF